MTHENDSSSGARDKDLPAAQKEAREDFDEVPRQMRAYGCPRCSGYGSNGVDGECRVCEGHGFRPSRPTDLETALMNWLIPEKGATVQ